MRKKKTCEFHACPHGNKNTNKNRLFHTKANPARPQQILYSIPIIWCFLYKAFPIGHRLLIRLFVGRYALGHVPSTSKIQITPFSQGAEGSKIHRFDVNHTAGISSIHHIIDPTLVKEISGFFGSEKLFSSIR